MLQTLVLCAVLSAPPQNSTIRDSHGQTIGRAVTNGARTTYYGKNGQFAGRAQSSKLGTTYYDQQGRITGKESSPKPTQSFNKVKSSNKR
jgi:hypothetical protein